ncbi:hypothetical protein OF83DRAFT_1178765, partial [Amylostereum chailletii]
MADPPHVYVRVVRALGPHPNKLNHFQGILILLHLVAYHIKTPSALPFSPSHSHHRVLSGPLTYDITSLALAYDTTPSNTSMDDDLVQAKVDNIRALVDRPTTTLPGNATILDYQR